MSLLTIRKYPDPVLRKLADPIDGVNDDLVRLSKDMLETMHMARGVGLAANQVGVPLQLIVLQLDPGKGHEPIMLINPVVVESSLEEVTEEGCLSFPGYYEYVKRAKAILIEARDMNEKSLRLECEGHLARAFQHEIDHLNGVLFIDHLSPVKRSLFRKRYTRTER